MLSDEFFKKDRGKYLTEILNSKSEKKLIIAGPGTGKTYTFKKLLEKYECNGNNKGLVITFIKNLVKDLENELGNLAVVRTFHSFCRSEIRKIKGRGFEYYPPLLSLIKEDISIIEPSIKFQRGDSLDNYFYDLDEKIIKKALEIADYYNAGGHTDSVYRVYKHYENSHHKIPSYPIVLVDEYQDFNLLETRLVEKLSEKSHILIVGDDDQALYTFRKSKADFLRILAGDSRYKKFDLPYCSRCPKVIIDAVNEIILISKRCGYLKDRIDKPFKYFPPDKRNDSIKNPKIVHVHCSVERKNCHYAAKYILNEILSMPNEYKDDAIRKDEPAALVIGPKQFLKQVKDHFLEAKDEISRKGWLFEEKKETEDTVHIIDGYNILMDNPESNLGWRIILGNNNQEEFMEILKDAIRKEKHIAAFIDEDVHCTHNKVINILWKIRNGEKLDKNDEHEILTKLGLSLDEVRSRINYDSNKIENAMNRPINQPRILCTTFEGSKGLAAQYVFILGFNEGHFPKNNPPRDIEICRLIVALTRARRKVYIFSYGFFGDKKLKDSIFIAYLNVLLSDKIYVDKKYIEKNIKK